jgi:hypothetical protein
MNVSLPRNRISTLRHIHEYIHELSNSDVSRVKGFCPIPQHDLFYGYGGSTQQI